MFPANGAANRTIQPREESLNSNVFSSTVVGYYYPFLSTAVAALVMFSVFIIFLLYVVFSFNVLIFHYDF